MKKNFLRIPKQELEERVRKGEANEIHLEPTIFPEAQGRKAFRYHERTYVLDDKKDSYVSLRKW